MAVVVAKGDEAGVDIASAGKDTGVGEVETHSCVVPLRFAWGCCWSGVVVKTVVEVVFVVIGRWCYSDVW